jgi:hypothetical protein
MANGGKKKKNGKKNGKKKSSVGNAGAKAIAAKHKSISKDSKRLGLKGDTKIKYIYGSDKQRKEVIKKKKNAVKNKSAKINKARKAQTDSILKSIRKKRNNLK